MGNSLKSKKKLNYIKKRIIKKHIRRKNPDFGSESWRNSVIQLIREYITCYRNSVFHFSEGKFQFIICACTCEHIDDSEQTVNVLETFCRTHGDRLRVFAILEFGNRLEAVLRHANERHFDFWGVRRGTGLLIWDINPVVECFSSTYFADGRHTFAECYLKYGFRYSHQNFVYQKRCYEFMNWRQGSSMHRRDPKMFRMLAKRNKFRMVLIMDTFDFFALPLIENRLRCLCYIYRSIAEPYVTPRELQCESLLINWVLPALLKHVVMMYRKYSNCFDQEVETLQPRPLSHLCRCKIRYVLSRKLELPDGIGKLKLPDKLASYLNLEW